MVVCICNQLNTEMIEGVIERHPDINPFEIHDVLKCNIACGTCLPAINDIIQTHRRRQNAGKRADL